MAVAAPLSIVAVAIVPHGATACAAQRLRRGVAAVGNTTMVGVPAPGATAARAANAPSALARASTVVAPLGMSGTVAPRQPADLPAQFGSLGSRCISIASPPATASSGRALNFNYSAVE